MIDDLIMRNVAIIFGLLVVPALVAYLFHLNVTMGGRVGIGAMFLFTAIGHWPGLHYQSVNEPGEVRRAGAIPDE